MPNKTTGQKSGTKRGFAAMPKEKTREAAAKGGQHSHGGGRNTKGKSEE